MKVSTGVYPGVTRMAAAAEESYWMAGAPLVGTDQIPIVAEPLVGWLKPEEATRVVLAPTRGLRALPTEKCERSAR